MPDLQSCNALQKIEYTSAKLECKTFSGKPGSRHHYGSVNTKIGTHRPRWQSLTAIHRTRRVLNLAYKDFVPSIYHVKVERYSKNREHFSVAN